jgi:hypothetical protein
MRGTTLLFVTAMAVVVALAAPASRSAGLAAPERTETGAVLISSLPFTYDEDTTGATDDGPSFCSNRASVFFSFTPDSDERIQVDTAGSDYDTVLSIYTRDEKAHPVKCNDDRFRAQSGVRFRASAGTTYIAMVASYGESGGQLTLHVSASDEFTSSIVGDWTEATIQVVST